MGLDNGFMAKRTGVARIDKRLNRLSSWTSIDRGEEEIAYWRKCWNVRRVVLNIISDTGENTEQYEFSVDYVDVFLVARELAKFNKKTWECDSVWDWEEIKHQHRRNVRRLRRLARLMRRYPFIEVHFYDSY